MANKRRCYVIGEMVLRHFPDLFSIEPGNDYENTVRYALFDAVLTKLAKEPELLAQLTDHAL